MVKLLITLLISVSAFAAGGGSHAGPGSLIYPAINLSIIAALFIWKVKPVFLSYFTGKHETVKEISERAKTQKFEAQMLLEKQQKKNNSLPETLKEIELTAKKEIDGFKEEKEKETENKIKKLEMDFGSKIEIKKQEMVKGINSELLEKIIAAAKNKVKGNPELVKKIDSSLTQGF